MSFVHLDIFAMEVERRRSWEWNEEGGNRNSEDLGTFNEFNLHDCEMMMLGTLWCEISSMDEEVLFGAHLPKRCQ